MTGLSETEIKKRVAAASKADCDEAWAGAYTWPFEAHPAQRAPDGDWLTWLFLGGRGAGKTRAGAEWLNYKVAMGAMRVALIGPTFNDVREVMLGGPSGLLTIEPVLDRPTYEASRKRIVWPGGAVGYAFSAEDPDGLRGPQFDAAWADGHRFRRHRLVRAPVRLARR
ncbi:MAG: terminase large subunit domain-containing protein, partial [Oceanicaulis sp.]